MSAHEAADAGNFLLVTSTAILFITYALIISERINRSVIALLGAGFTIALGVLNQEQAIAAIDFNTLGLLAGMMMIVGVSKKSGLFGYVAIRAAQIVRGSPAGIMMAFVIVTAMFSALLDNVTTVLLLVPVTFVVCGELKLPVYPFLFTEIFAGNIGGTATLIGDPPNILIGSAAGLNFNDFVVALAPVVLIILVLQMIANHLIWGIKLKASAEERARVMSLNAREMIVDKYLLVCSLGVISMVMLAFTTAHFIKLEAATIAMFGAAILLLLESFAHKPHKHSELVTHAFHEVEWITLFFFVGLFIVIGGVEHAGLLNMAANKLLSVTGGNLEIMTYGILWTSAILSAIVDNIPFVATMIPLINSVAPVMGGEHVIMPLWWALSLGACLGGNGTLVGASANLTVVGLAEKNGVHFSFVKFTALAFPMMLASIAIAHVYLMWRFF